MQIKALRPKKACWESDKIEVYLKYTYLRPPPTGQARAEKVGMISNLLKKHVLRKDMEGLKHSDNAQKMITKWYMMRARTSFSHKLLE